MIRKLFHLLIVIQLTLALPEAQNELSENKVKTKAKDQSLSNLHELENLNEQDTKNIADTSYNVTNTITTSPDPTIINGVSIDAGILKTKVDLIWKQPAHTPNVALSKFLCNEGYHVFYSDFVHSERQCVYDYGTSYYCEADAYNKELGWCGKCKKWTS